jgi:hypothetical protein
MRTTDIDLRRARMCFRCSIGGLAIHPNGSPYFDLNSAHFPAQRLSTPYSVIPLSAFTTTFQGQTQDKKECFCGKLYHFRDCFYLVEEKWPKGWKANQDIQERVDVKLRNPRVKEAVEPLPEQSQPPEDKKEFLKRTPSRLMEPLPSLLLRPHRNERARTLYTTALSSIQPRPSTCATNVRDFRCYAQLTRATT